MKRADFEKLSPKEQEAVRKKARDYQAARRDKLNGGAKPKKRGRRKKTQTPEHTGADAAMPFLEALLKLPEKVATLEKQIAELRNADSAEILETLKEVLADNKQMKDFIRYGKKPEWGKV